MSTIYEIHISGHLATRWSEWLGGVAITHLENGDTCLCGEVADQAALHGLLNRIRDLNLKLVRVEMKDCCAHHPPGGTPGEERETPEVYP